MRAIPKISDAEWEIMSVMWKKPKALTSQEIIDAVAGRQMWHPKTVRTLLTRLAKKGAVGFEKEGRGYIYRALVTKKDCVQAVSQSFLDRVFGGSLKPMLAHFVREKEISKAELEELKRLLKGRK